MAAGTSPAPRKVMVVADSSCESAAALQYTLSHGLTDHDELILLHVDSPGSWRKTFSISALFRRHSYHYNNNRRHNRHPHIFHSQHRPRRRRHNQDSSTSRGGADEGEASGHEAGPGVGEMDFLEDMKSLCEVTQPNVRVRIEKVENKERKDKASVILHQSELQGVESLIIGQRRSPAFLGFKRSAAGSAGRLDTAEYLIKHSKCTCVSVQKKGQNEGYLLNTKTCRNFWLLA